MKAIRKNQKLFVTPLISTILALSAGPAHATGMFGEESLIGDFVIAADGGFVALTPFAQEPLRLSVALVGRLTFDGAGQVQGEWTVSFHHEVVPFGVRSHFKAVGEYDVESNGHMFMDFEEFKVEPPPADDGVADALPSFECYIVARLAEARCVLNQLISLQQGPENPVPEPITLSGSLLRQK